MVTCPVCFQSNTQLFLKGLEDKTFKTTDEKFDLWSCNNCDAKFISPQIAEEELGKYYPSSAYHPFQSSQIVPLHLPFYPMSIYLRELKKIYQPHDKFSLIDIGCGGGTFLKSVQHYFPNAELFGVDVSEEAIKNVKLSGIDGMRSSLYDINLEKKFDYITASQILEHLNRPHDFLKVIKKLATPETKIMIDVPATDSYSAQKYGRHWLHWDLPRHSILYSAKTFGILFKEFNTDEIKYGGSFLAVVSSRKLSKEQNIYQHTLIESFWIKAITFVTKRIGMKFLYSDKLIWMGTIKP